MRSLNSRLVASAVAALVFVVSVCCTCSASSTPGANATGHSCCASVKHGGIPRSNEPSTPANPRCERCDRLLVEASVPAVDRRLDVSVVATTLLTDVFSPGVTNAASDQADSTRIGALSTLLALRCALNT